MMLSIVNREYSAILLYAPPGWSSLNARWSTRLQSAIFSSYELEKTIASTEIYRPRK
jgi:hypothetical protein